MKHKILVVDDEQSVADTLCIIFQKYGFESRAAHSGAEAIACVGEFCPKLLLCDISMPGTGGLEVILHITKKYPSCRVLLLTGHYTNLAYVHKWARAHPAPSRIMTKPMPPALLLEAAGHLLQTPQS
jgi:CheY-like chemotaxis protein